MTTTTSTPRRGRPRDEAIDAAILDATVEELIAVGMFAMSMERIATRAGVAKTTVYRRYPDSADLGLEALRRLKGAAVEPPEGSPRDQIVALAQQMRRVWANPTFAAAMRRVAAEASTRPEVYRETRDRLVGPHLRMMNAAVERAQDAGIIDPGADVDWVRRMIIGPVLSAVFTLQSPPSAEELERGVDVVLRGLAP